MAVLGLETWAFVRWQPQWPYAVLMVIAGWVCGAAMYASIAPPSELPLRAWYQRVPGSIVFWIVVGFSAWALSGPHQVWWYAVPVGIAAWAYARGRPGRARAPGVRAVPYSHSGQP